MRVVGAADVVVSLSGGKTNGNSATLNPGASFENAGTVSFSGDSFVVVAGSDVFAPSVTKVSLSNVKLYFGADTVNEVRSISGGSGSTFTGSGLLALRPASEEDEASGFSGSIDPACTLTLAKRGAGTSTATVTSGVVPNLHLEEGTLVINAACTVSGLTAEAGTRLVADGVKVSLKNPPTDIGILEAVNGGSFELLLDASSDLSDIRRYAWDHELVKTGAGEVRLYDPSLTGFVHVAEGKLSFSRFGLRERYLKFTIKELLPYWDYQTGKECALDGMRARVYFYGTNEVRCTDAASYTTRFVLGTQPSALTKGEVTAPSETVWTKMGDYTDPFFMFRTSGGNPCKWLTGALTNAADKVNFQVIYYRLPDPISAAIDGINVDSIYGWGNPKKWTVESSATGEDGTWQTILEKDEKCAGMSSSRSGCLNGNSMKPAYLFSYVEPGVQGLADTLQVQVDADATLDFTAKTGGQAVDAITIDFEKGGGLLKGAKLAPSGTLYLVNSTMALLKTPLPLTLKSLGDAGNLRNWTLVVDGIPKDRRLAYDSESGKISVLPNGMMLIVR